jgi:ribulose-5-phosphate 4-epimerase/fuculose-1-phosphate aldolase
MCGYMAPGVVSSSADLIEYYISDGSTVDPKAKKGYSERFIHGELFKRFPDVNCVIHSHAEAVLPYVTSGVPLLPVFHMAGFLGELCCCDPEVESSRAKSIIRPNPSVFCCTHN